MHVIDRGQAREIIYDDAYFDMPADSPAMPPSGVDAWMQWWNAPAAAPAGLPPPAAWRAAVHGWREQLAAQSDLCSRLIGFIASQR